MLTSLFSFRQTLFKSLYPIGKALHHQYESLRTYKLDSAWSLSVHCLAFPFNRVKPFHRCQQSLHLTRVTRRISNIDMAWMSHITYRQKPQHIQRTRGTPFQWNTNYKGPSQRIFYLYSYYLITGDRIYQVSLAWRKHLSFLTLKSSSRTFPTQVDAQLTDSKTLWVRSLNGGLHDEPLSWNGAQSRRKITKKLKMPYQKSGAWQASDDTRHLSVDSPACECLPGNLLLFKDK